MAYQRLLELVRLDAADEEGIALAQGRHEELETLLELRAEGRRPLPRLRAHGEVAGEDGLEELVLRDVDQLEEVGREGVAVLVEEGPRVVEDDPGKVVKAERGVDVRLGLQVVAVVAVSLMKLVQ